MPDSLAPEREASGLDLERVARRLKPLGSPVRLRLLRFLTRPHYLEEVASFLKMSRFAAKRHIDELSANGLLRAVPGRRDSGPVRDYIVAPDAFFELYDAVRSVGELRPAPEAFAESLPGFLTRTRTASAPRAHAHAGPVHPYLVSVYGPEIGRAYPLAAKRSGTAHWTVGRDAACEVALDLDPFTSNRHARIALAGAGFSLTDAYSTNGTWRNWERLPEGETAALRHGDILGIGRTLLVFHTPIP